MRAPAQAMFHGAAVGNVKIVRGQDDVQFYQNYHCLLMGPRRWRRRKRRCHVLFVFRHSRIIRFHQVYRFVEKMNEPFPCHRTSRCCVAWSATEKRRSEKRASRVGADASIGVDAGVLILRVHGDWFLFFTAQRLFWWGWKIGLWTKGRERLVAWRSSHYLVPNNFMCLWCLARCPVSLRWPCQMPVFSIKNYKAINREH